MSSSSTMPRPRARRAGRRVQQQRIDNTKRLKKDVNDADAKVIYATNIVICFQQLFNTASEHAVTTAATMHQLDMDNHVISEEYLRIIIIANSAFLSAGKALKNLHDADAVAQKLNNEVSLLENLVEMDEQEQLRRRQQHQHQLQCQKLKTW